MITARAAKRLWSGRAGPELALLLRCLRTGLGFPAAPPEATPTDREPDWPVFVALAGWHGASAIAHGALPSIVPNPPADVLGQLRFRGQAGSLRGALLLGELTQVVRSLGDAGVPTIPFKGPVLAATLYDHPWQRETTDLDVLIRKEDLPRALAALDESYVLARSPGPDRANLLHRASGTSLDLHHGIIARRTPADWDIAGVWQRARVAKIGGAEMPSLSDEDLVLALCAHGSRHAWECLKWVCDIARLVTTRPQLQWELALNRAENVGGRRWVLLGCSLATELLGADLPQSLRRAMRSDRWVWGLRQAAIARVLRPAERTRGLRRAGRDISWAFSQQTPLATARCLGDLACHLFVPNARDLAGSPLPRRLRFLHAFTRPIRLWRTYR